MTKREWRGYTRIIVRHHGAGTHVDILGNTWSMQPRLGCCMPGDSEASCCLLLLNTRARAHTHADAHTTPPHTDTRVSCNGPFSGRDQGNIRPFLDPIYVLDAYCDPEFDNATAIRRPPLTLLPEVLLVTAYFGNYARSKIYCNNPLLLLWYRQVYPMAFAIKTLETYTLDP